MQFLVIGWLVLEVTGSRTQLGVVLFLYGIPNVAVLIVGGIIADRMDRKLLLMATQAAVGLVIAALAVLSVFELVVMAYIYVAAILLGVLQGLNQPARVAVLSDLMDQRTLLDAVAHFNAGVHLGRIFGPYMVGEMIDRVGTGPGLFVNAGFYAVSVLFLWWIRTPLSRPVQVSKSLLRNLVDGLIVIRDTPVLLTVIVVTCSFGGFGMSHLQVIPAFAKEQLSSDAAAAGLLLTASGIGSLIGNLCLTFMGRAWLYRWLLLCLLVFSISLTLFSWSNSFWMAWALFLVVGIVSLGTVWPLATTILQLEAPVEVRGRVMGVLHFTPGFHYLGALPLAAAAGWVGWPVSISMAAALCLFVTIWFGLVRKSGRELAAQPATG